MEVNDPICSVQGLYNYTSTDPASLSFGQGDIIHVLAKLESGWWDGWCNGRRGWFPSNYVEEITTEMYLSTEQDIHLNHTSLIQQRQENPHQQHQEETSRRLDSTISIGIHNERNDEEDDDKVNEQIDGMVHRSHRDDLQHQTIPTKSNWILQTTEDGSEVYYYNVVTKEMRYSLPPDTHFDPNLPSTSMSQQNDVINPTTTTSTVINHHNNRLQSDIINTNQKTVSPAPPSLPSQTTTTTVTNSNIPSSTNSIADPDEIPLPPHWVRKVDTKGRVYFCNLLTDETTWNLDQIDPQTGNLNTISTTQRSRGPTSNTNVANQENQPLSWNQLSTLIAHAIHGLKNSIKEGQTSLLRDDAIMVVHRIRLMLYVSNTVDKESSSHLKANKSLRVFHRALLASLAKTVLSTKAASGTWSQEDALHKLQMDVDQLLVDVGNFLSAARDLRLEIYDDKPRLLLPDLKTSMSSNGHRWRLASSNMDNINKPDPSTTLLVLADNIRGAMSSFMESVHSAFSSLNDQVSVPNKVKTTAPLLVAQFRNLSNTASQFLNAVDDLPFLPQQGRSTSKNNKSTPKGYPARQAIYNAMGLLFIASQTITNGELTISMIKMTYRRLEDCIYEIEKNVQTICQDVTTATATTTTKTTKTINHNKPSSSSSSTTRTTTRDITPPTPASRTDTISEQDMPTRDILDEIYADEEIMGSGFDSIHPTAITPGSTPQSPHPYHSPASSAKYPPSSSASSSYYHPHPSVYSPSLLPHDDDNMEVDSYHSATPYNGYNNETSSPPPTTPTPRPPKDKLAKFFGEDTLLAAKRRDTVLGGPSSMVANGMASPSTTTTATTTTTTITTATTTNTMVTAGSSATNTTGVSASTPTTAHHNGSLLMGNDKPEYLCADYKQNEIIFNMEGNVKGGTVLALVQRLTQHDQKHLLD